MKTGSELVAFKGNNTLNKQQFISDFEKFRSRQITDVDDTSHEIFDEDDEVDEIDTETPQENEISPDELVMNGGTNIKHYHSYPYGIGTAPNMYNDNGVSKVKNFTDFTGVRNQ